MNVATNFRRIHSLGVLVVTLCAAPLVAQDNPFEKLASHWKTSKEFTLAVANQMPAESYGFKPNPEQMSFGQQMAHIATANSYFYSIMTGDKPIQESKKFDKESVLKLLNETFDATAKALPLLTPEQLHKSYKTPDGEMAGFEIILFAMDHTTHHRGQCEVYLRVKGIKPTDYRF